MLPRLSPFRRGVGRARSSRSPLTLVPATVLVGAGAVLALAGSPHRAQAQDVLAAAPRPYQAWTQVPEYKVHYESRFAQAFSIPLGSQMHDYEMDMRATATGKIKFVSSNGRYWIYEGNLAAEGTYAMDEHWYSPTATLGTSTDRGSGTDVSGMGMLFRLVIDTGTGTFEITTTDVGLAGTTVIRTKNGEINSPNVFQIPCPAPKGASLPSPRPPLSVNEAFEVPAPPAWRLANPVYTAEMQVTLSIAPVGTKPEFLLKPVSPKWIPAPNGSISAQVVPKKPNQTPAPIRFILEEITQEPGTSLNSQETGTEPDLEFDPNSAGFEAPEQTGPNSFRMESDGPVNGGTARIRALDYGAWGKLRAEAQIDGIWEPIPVEKSKLGYVTLPLDTDANKVADEWERTLKIKGRAATWDAEVLPTLNGTTGDGLSYYEEYRGMLTEGKHQRLDPRVKKLVVENQAGSQAKPGIALLAAASKLKVITVNPGELPEDRVVNRNSSVARTRIQHGLRLKNVGLPEGVLGQALPVETPNKRPATCTEVQVDIAQILASPAPYQVQAELSNTIAHELAHGLGASHHGEAGAPLIDRFLGTAHQPPAHIVYGSDRKEITTRPFEIQGKIGGLGSLASGDEGCIMCYNSYYQWAVHRTTQGQYRYYAQQYRRPGTRFCTSRNGTGVNSPKNKPAPFFGHAERGNCLGQLCPKDN